MATRRRHRRQDRHGISGQRRSGTASVNAAYVLLSGQTGQPRVSIDGRALTLIRTAAGSALAADLLAPAAPEVLLMVGTGALSRYFRRRPSGRPPVSSRSHLGPRYPQGRRRVRDLSARGWPVTAAPDLEAAARSADVISCATPGAATAHPGPLAQIPMSLGFGRQLQAQHERRPTMTACAAPSLPSIRAARSRQAAI